MSAILFMMRLKRSLTIGSASLLIFLNLLIWGYCQVQNLRLSFRCIFEIFLQPLNCNFRETTCHFLKHECSSSAFIPIIVSELKFNFSIFNGWILKLWRWLLLDDSIWGFQLFLLNRMTQVLRWLITNGYLNQWFLFFDSRCTFRSFDAWSFWKQTIGYFENFHTSCGSRDFV